MLDLTPSSMRSIAGRLDALTQATEDERLALHDAWNRLDANWQSYARGDVEGAFRRAMGQAARMQTLIAHMALALARSADRFERADEEARLGFTDPVPVVAISAPVSALPGEAMPGPASSWSGSAVIAAIDAALLALLNQWLPADLGGTEYVTEHVGASVDIPGGKIPVMVGGDGRITVRRMPDGTLQVTLNGSGMLGAQLDTGMWGYQAALKAGMTGVFVFDPKAPGDMVALGLLLTEIGAKMAQLPLISTAANLAQSYNAKLDWQDNLRSVIVESGGSIGMIVRNPLLSYARADVEWATGGGWERDVNGVMQPFMTARLGGGGRLDVTMPLEDGAPKDPAVFGANAATSGSTSLKFSPGPPTRTTIEIHHKISEGDLLQMSGAALPNAAGKYFWAGGLDQRVVGGVDHVTSVVIDAHLDVLAEQLAAGKLDLAALQRDGIAITVSNTTVANSETAGEINVNVPDLGSFALDGAYGRDGVLLP